MTDNIATPTSLDDTDGLLQVLGYTPTNEVDERHSRLRDVISRADFARNALDAEVRAQNNRLADLISVMEITQQKSADILQGLLETHSRYNIIQRDLRRVQQTMAQLQQLAEEQWQQQPAEGT
ncbi:hypothetical protein NM688_g1768 [Phlebia brevispora]|uniref:Uncharacterized protein n=1 Tax=Phlebia brevispora TaxID=194682 RepID=A0ACC1TAV5_9APHY|nr:hypothetical protein NM688_g1768 [Phlebia brevispora]